MIRPFDPSDLEQLVILLERLRLDTDYRAVTPDWDHIINLLIVKSQRKDGLIVVAEHAKQLTGVLIGTAETLWWVNQGNGARIASDLVFYSERFGDGRQLLRAFSEWAFDVSRVVRIEMGVSSKAPLSIMRRLYTAEGFVQQGSFFVKNHPRYADMLAPITASVEAPSKGAHP